MADLETNNLAPFLKKTYALVDDPNTNDLISWNYSRQTFIVWDHLEFSRSLLQQHFRHNNFSSFVYQLNNYGFRKANNEPCEYYHKFFQPGRRDLLYNIKSRSALKREKCKEKETESPLNRFHPIELECEILKKEHEKLKNELNELRREHENLEKQLANDKSEEVVHIVMKALSNPSFFQQLIKNIAGDEIEETGEQVTKKPRLSEEIDKTQDYFEPNFGDFFAIDKIREFLLKGAATLPNASQGHLEGESHDSLMELVTNPLELILIEDKEDA